MKTDRPEFSPGAESAAKKLTQAPISERATRVLLVDDHPTFREGLKSLIEHEGSLIVCAEADSERGAIKALEGKALDMMIVDLNLGNDSGLKLIQRVRLAYPQLRILVVSMYDESMYGERAINAGADGYICKQDEPEKLTTAIERVSKGERYTSRGLADRLAEQKASGCGAAAADPVEILTARELQVFGLIGNGYSTKEIAAKLHVSPKTIDAHRDHIKSKIGISDNSRLVHRAVEWGLSQ